MSRPLFRAIVSLVTCAGFLFLGESFVTTPKPPAIIKTDVRNAQAQLADSNLVVWAAGTDGSIVVEIYNPKLQLVHSYRKIVPDFEAHEVKLLHADNSWYEFSALGSGEYN